MIYLKDINKIYNNGVLFYVFKGINFDIEWGEFVFIMGVLGFGKFILFNILGILDNYDDGEYYFNNVLIKDLSEIKFVEYCNWMIGFIF